VSRICVQTRNHELINQETASDQLDASDVATTDAAQRLEATKKATYEMSTVAAHIQSTTSVASSTDNPIALVDWISSFLETLKKFNALVDQIIAVSVTLCFVSPPMLIQCLDSSLRASSVDCPLVCSQGLAIALLLVMHSNLWHADICWTGTSRSGAPFEDG